MLFCWAWESEWAGETLILGPVELFLEPIETLPERATSPGSERAGDIPRSDAGDTYVGEESELGGDKGGAGTSDRD